MLRYSLLTLFITIRLVSSAFGPAFGTGPVSEGNFIKEAISTLIVPTGNQPLTGYLALWVGMGTSNGDLIQSAAVRHAGGNANANTACESIVTDSQWCAFTYVQRARDAVIGTSVRILAGDRLTSHYVYDAGTKKYTQYLALNGNVISTLATDSGKAIGFGTALECSENNCGTLPAHKWVDTTITMNVADPHYGKTQGQSGGATNSGFSTPDGGKTWKVATINIPSHRFPS